ncbi:MAG: ATP-binding protein [Planctomycetota bacterium]
MTSLDLAERSHLISKFTEAAARLGVWGVLLIGLLLLTLRSNITPLIRKVVIFFVSLALCQLVLTLTDDIRSLDGVAIVGYAGHAHYVLIKGLSALWTGGAFWLLYLLLKSSYDSREELERRVEQRTRELSQSNEQLARQIEQKQSIQATLDATNQTLEVRIQERTQQLQDALEQLKAAQRRVVQQEQLSALGRMASGIAHELNNTLAPIVSYTELLQQKPLDPRQSEWKSCISECASDASRVLRQLQQFYRPNKSPRLEEIDLRSIVEQISNRTRPRWKDSSELHGYSIGLELNLDHVPKIQGNVVELRQLFTNLVLNAIDASPEGGRISLGLKERNDEVVVTISDTGSGMDPSTIEHCFEPFFTTKQEGVGMGLSICHGIVQRHHGSIDVQSQVGKGTTVEVRFPVVHPEPTRNGGNGQPVTTAAPLSNGTDGIRVLCIEDDDCVRKSTVALLQSFGAIVRDASSGAMGLELLQEDSFDVVLTDLGMANMDGSDVVTAIKQDFPKLPVILVSGWSATEVADRLKNQAVPDQILEKPATYESLSRALGIVRTHGPAITMPE